MDLIAEIGWNHMGDLDLAEKMIEAAAFSGATHAKFQTWHVRDLRPGPWDADGRREIYVKAELSLDDFRRIKSACDGAGVSFLTSIFNPVDIDDMASLSDAEIKIPSPEINNIELLEEAGRKFKKVFLATGASSETEIDRALKVLTGTGTEVILMHCVSIYPCPDDKVNLPRLEMLSRKHTLVGISDHTLDSLSAVFALAKGVVAIEKHFTIDNDLPGRDNSFSILPEEFRRLSDAARRYKNMSVDIGIGYQPEEEEIRKVYRGRWDSK